MAGDSSLQVQSQRDSTPTPPNGKASDKKARQINIDVYSDNICPFCYLGYRKICAAMDEAKKEGLPLDFSLRFKPFMLDPTLPVDHPVLKMERYKAKFGDRAPAIFSAMEERGKGWGINFSYNGPLRNTFLSHRMVEKAHKEGGEDTQRTFIEKIFEGYFELEKDIGDPQYLAETAVECHIFEDKEEALEFLDSSELKNETCKAIKEAASLGISGVPFFCIDNKYAVSGAQEPKAFLDIFRKISCGQCPCDK